MVTTTSAPSTASGAVSATAMPSSASGSAFSLVRFHARTSWPAPAMLRAIAAPMIPVPRTATVSVSFELMDAGLPRACAGVSLLRAACAARAPTVWEGDEGVSVPSSAHAERRHGADYGASVDVVHGGDAERRTGPSGEAAV